MNRVLFGIALLVGAPGILAGCFSSANGSGVKDGGIADVTSSSSGGGSGSGSGSGSSSGGSSGGSTDGGGSNVATMFVPDDMANVVYVYSVTPSADPVFSTSISVPSAVSVALSPTGELFVTSFADGNIYRFLSPFGTPTANGTITNSGLSTTSEGSTFVDDELWIADFAGSDLVRVAFGAQGATSVAGTVNNVAECEGIYWDGTSRILYVSQAYSSGINVQHYQVAADHSVTPLTPIMAPNPYGSVVTPWGDLLVANPLGQSVSRFSVDAQGNATASGTITGNGFNYPLSLTFAPWGELFVGNQGSGTVSRFTFDSSHNAVPNGTFQTKSGAAPNGAGHGSRMDWVVIYPG